MNNCETCEHFAHKGGGHCYMFRREPQGQCMQHTALRGPLREPYLPAGTYRLPAGSDLLNPRLSPEWQAVADAIHRYGWYEVPRP